MRLLPCNSVRQNGVGSKSRSYEENWRFKAKPIFGLKPLQFVHISILSVTGRGLGCGGKNGVCFRTSVKYSSGLWPIHSYILTSGIGNVRSSGSKTSLTSSWHGNLNFRRFSYFLSGFCFRSEFYFRNNISSTFRARDLVTIAEVGSTRLTSLERVTIRVSDRFPGALGRNLIHSADQCDLCYV